eukprot:CAMPEP_0204843168 /NCGR_PEP_ID=MMETSP1346-20131115/47817_1 /ASSEMBLY_ACC=CAM_ASM_000771 /TAXON_ID=215587 /ORGANISM="Aplanochytrium stocchinoi, Strain GSBS06" /LENGTH=673 /DNA_ID=CAMNT_0051982259 /DNA_START=720 /DNA_END=2741 /DNA_ORIENTATION=-
MNGLNVNAKTFNQIDHHNQDYNKKKNSVENETMSLRNEDNVGVQNEPEYKDSEQSQPEPSPSQKPPAMNYKDAATNGTGHAGNKNTTTNDASNNKNDENNVTTSRVSSRSSTPSHESELYEIDDVKTLELEVEQVSISENAREQDGPVKLFVGQVPPHMEENDVGNFFTSNGYEIVACSIIRDQNTGKHKSCAFVILKSREMANNAIKQFHNKHTFPSMSNPVQVSEATKNRSPSSSFSNENPYEIQPQSPHSVDTSGTAYGYPYQQMPQYAQINGYGAAHYTTIPEGMNIQAPLSPTGMYDGAGMPMTYVLPTQLSYQQQYQYAAAAQNAYVNQYAMYQMYNANPMPYSTHGQVATNYGVDMTQGQHVNFKGGIIENTKLFIANIPLHITESELQPIFEQYGVVKGIRISRNNDNSSKGTATVRFDSRINANEALKACDGKYKFEVPVPEQQEDAEDKHGDENVNPENQNPPMSVKWAFTRRNTHSGNYRGQHLVGGPRSDNYNRERVNSVPNAKYTYPYYDPLYYQQHYNTYPGVGVNGYAQNLTMHNSSQNETNSTTSGNDEIQDGPLKERPLSYVEGPVGANLFVNNLPESVTDEELSKLFEEYGKILSAKVFIDKFSMRSRGFGFVSFSNTDEADEAIKNKNSYVMPGFDNAKPLVVEKKKPRKQLKR